MAPQDIPSVPPDYIESVVDELLGLKFPLETAQQLCQKYSQVLLECYNTGILPFSIAAQIEEENEEAKLIQQLHDDTATRNAANQQYRETYSPYQILHGYDSQDHSFIIEDYPHSFHMRCRQRYWVDTATKGSKNGQQRVGHQTSGKGFNKAYTEVLRQSPDGTSSPVNKPLKLDYIEEHMPGMAVNEAAIAMVCDDWCQPKYSTYSEFMFLYLDEIGHIHTGCMSVFSGPNEWEGFRAKWHIEPKFCVVPDGGGLPVCQFDKEQLTKLAELEEQSRKYNPASWKEWLASELNKHYKGILACIS